MTETRRLKKVFADLYNGEPWLEVTIAGTLKGIGAKTAAFKVNPQINSIWEITNHMIWWRMNILERISGKIIDTPDHNYILPVTDDSDIAWAKTKEKFEQTELDWLLHFKKLKKTALKNVYPANGLSFYDHIQGIIQHDAYHLGQLVLLCKHFVAST